MKKLKLDHDVARRIVEGSQRSTWRMFDDKELTVNDEVTFVDKVDPENAASWKVIGSGRINRIIEKRLGEVTDEDYGDRPTHGSVDERLAAYREYYGDKVTLDTPVKMIDFDFTPAAEGGAEADEPSVPKLIGEKVILYADGGSRGNPGPSAYGFVIMDEQGEVLVDKGVYMGITTNNQAEYQGLRNGLIEAKKMGAREVTVRLDSLLVINQMKGIFKVKNRDLWPIYESIKNSLGDFRKVTFTHVPRELNKAADAAVNRALDERMAGRGMH